MFGFRVCLKPGGRQMPSPRAMPDLLMPHPGTDKARKCPAVAGGGGGWAQLELTDALLDS